MKKSKNKNMVDFITQNWAVLLGGGTITSIFGWVFYGRKNNNVEYTSKVQGIFEKITSELEKDRDYYKQEYINARKEHKEEVVYFRTKIDDLQSQFNNMSISYTKEVEVSQNWEKLYRELTVQHQELEKANEKIQKENQIIKKTNVTITKEQAQLKKAYENLKTDHDNLKKAFNEQQKTKTNPKEKKSE